jgi:hypothetical protein
MQDVSAGLQRVLLSEVGGAPVGPASDGGT